jgi:hypothetical protein
VFEYIAKRTRKEMTQILKEHRDGKLKSVIKIRSKNPLELQQGQHKKEKKRGRKESKRGVQ